MTLANGEIKVWEKSVESPEEKKGHWVINFSPEKDVGESASEALIFTLRKIAREITEDASIRKFILKPVKIMSYKHSLTYSTI